jgi:hypothetical protein
MYEYGGTLKDQVMLDRKWTLVIGTQPWNIYLSVSDSCPIEQDR